MMSNAMYEALPAVYIGSGILNAVLLESPVRYFPSILFICAGTLISIWRWNARHQPQSKAPGTPESVRKRGIRTGK